MRRRIMAVAVAVAVVAVCAFASQGCRSCTQERRPVAQQQRDPPGQAAGGYDAGTPSGEADAPSDEE
jgi:hypothetical protein